MRRAKLALLKIRKFRQWDAPEEVKRAGIARAADRQIAPGKFCLA
jgi:hypothetical protein